MIQEATSMDRDQISVEEYSRCLRRSSLLAAEPWNPSGPGKESLMASLLAWAFGPLELVWLFPALPLLFVYQ